MPNWTSNRIYIEGDQADIRAFLETVKWEDELFDFNRIIPMPELLKHTGSGHRTIDGKKAEAWYIIKHAKYDPPQEAEVVRLFTPEEEAELTAIGHPDWYSWCRQNWGTKWNACRTEIEDSSKSGYAEITFETAWSAPVPVLCKMVEMFPKLTFNCRWRYEDESPYPHSLDDEPDAIPAVSAILKARGRRSMTQEQMAFGEPSPHDEIARLTKELESERSYRKQIEKDLQKLRRTHWAYKAIDDLYKSLKRDAEADAQDPFDEHFRECLYGLQAIAADPDACTCETRGWSGEGHDTQCPIRIATDACERADTALGEGLNARNPLYVGSKGGAA